MSLSRIAGVALLALAAGTLVAAPDPARAATTTITVDGTQGGRTFDGIGAISGGGGNSRLLIDYPEPQRGQILDYLFTPGVGADLQILKAEIGGDANSTDGAEPSHEHVRGTVDCNAGYEWWLMEQAKARNPNIKLYGLAWAAPGWIGGGNFWSTDMVNYLVAWLGCARQHGLTIDYLGGWNERGHDKSWYESLHAALAPAGFGNVKVVGDDTGWGVADDMVADPTFNASVDVIGVHYPCGYLGAANSCGGSSNANATGKQLWASENGSQDINTGAAALIRSITRGYLDARLTAYLHWPLLAAITPNLPYQTVGLAVAPQPWSGAYSLGKQTWATAQVTQFTAPGWTFVDSASGYLGGDRANGSYVTLKAPGNAAYSTVYETTTTTAAQTVNVSVRGGLPTGTVHVWATNLASNASSSWFVHTSDVTPSGGAYSLTLQPGYVYTVSTVTGAGKGTATSPAESRLALPYSDTFDGTAVGGEAKYLSDMQGAYQVEACAGGRSGRCLQQMAPVRPIEWQDDSDAYALLGDTGWGNYTVRADALLASAGSVELMARATTQARPQSHQAAYYLRVSNTGAWSIRRGDTGGGLTTLASGTTTALGTGSWHTLALTAQGATLTAAIDGRTLGSATDQSYPYGQAGIGVVGYQNAQFDNLSLTAGTAAATPIASGVAGKCADDNTNASADGTHIQVWDCNGGAAQNWTVNSDGTLRINGKCMDINGAATANNTTVQLWTCNGGGNQIWRPNNGTLINPASGRCLDDPGAATTNGTQLIIFDCNGGQNQRWTIP